MKSDIQMYTIPGIQLSTLNECDDKYNHYYDQHILNVHIRVIVNIEITFNLLSEDVVHESLHILVIGRGVWKQSVMQDIV